MTDWTFVLEVRVLTQPASVVCHKYGYEDARAFWLSARRPSTSLREACPEPCRRAQDEQWRAPREEEQRSRRPKGPADS